MKKALQLPAALAAILLLAVSCDELFRPGGPDIPYDSALDVLEARGHAGETGAWVHGYIVGVAAGSKKILLEAPFTKGTNLILGPSDTSTVRDHFLSVELPAGRIRTELNLQDHPDLRGRKIYIKGNLVSAYYGIPGLKSPSEYQIDSGSSPE